MAALDFAPPLERAQTEQGKEGRRVQTWDPWMGREHVDLCPYRIRADFQEPEGGRGAS